MFHMFLQIWFSFSSRIDLHLNKLSSYNFLWKPGWSHSSFPTGEQQNMTERSQKKARPCLARRRKPGTARLSSPAKHGQGHPMLIDFCSTLDPWSPERSTLNPQTPTSNPQPLTFKRHSSTLNPQPPTMNPQPSAVNASNATFNSKNGITMSPSSLYDQSRAVNQSIICQPRN